jgi:glutamate synthase domain-containing protein 3
VSETEQEGKLAREFWHKGQSDEAMANGSSSATRASRQRQAKRVLERWSDCRAKFVKVFPNEYRRALGEMARKHKRLAA